MAPRFWSADRPPHNHATRVRSDRDELRRSLHQPRCGVNLLCLRSPPPIAPLRLLLVPSRRPSRHVIDATLRAAQTIDRGAIFRRQREIERGEVFDHVRPVRRLGNCRDAVLLDQPAQRDLARGLSVFAADRGERRIARCATLARGE